jgi:hypothetical protein
MRFIRLLLVVALIATVLALSGCGKDEPKKALVPATDPAGRETCFMNQRTAQAEVWQWESTGGRPFAGMSAAGLVKAGALSEEPECPSGGEFVFNPNDASFTCSVHGWAPD